MKIGSRSNKTTICSIDLVREGRFSAFLISLQLVTPDSINWAVEGSGAGSNGAQHRQTGTERFSAVHSQFRLVFHQQMVLVVFLWFRSQYGVSTLNRETFIFKNLINKNHNYCTLVDLGANAPITVYSNSLYLLCKL